ncbi:MAG: hypothetical protein ACLTW9_04280 [Enterocloster sp.]
MKIRSVYDELMEESWAPVMRERHGSSITGSSYEKRNSEKRYGPGRTPARIGLSQNHLEGTIQ